MSSKRTKRRPNSGCSCSWPSGDYAGVILSRLDSQVVRFVHESAMSKSQRKLSTSMRSLSSRSTCEKNRVRSSRETATPLLSVFSDV